MCIYVHTHIFVVVYVSAWLSLSLSLYIYIYIYIYIHIYIRGAGVLLTEILLPRVARLDSNRSTGNRLSTFTLSKSSNWEMWARTTRIEKFELDQGFQPLSFTIQVRERNPLLSKSERGILYWPSPREASFTIQVRERNPLLSKSERGILNWKKPSPTIFELTNSRIRLSFSSASYYP